jgi:hypothetical protein
MGLAHILCAITFKLPAGWIASLFLLSRKAVLAERYTLKTTAAEFEEN